MPKKCIKFIPEYLIPNLNDKRFGERLKWIDKSKNIFEIDWRHKAGPEWTKEEASVFVEWDKHKGHFKPGIKEYYTQSKQRFRALLYKLTKEGYLIEMASETKFKKVYCISQEKKIRRKKRYSNVEYESYNEEETSLGEQENGVIDDTAYRKVSEEDAVNVLEDHCYSVSRNAQDNSTGSLIYAAENEQATLQYTLLTNISYESSENSQKRILMERNSESLNLLPYSPLNFYHENIPSFEASWDGLENTTSMFAGKLPTDSNHPVSQNIFSPSVCSEIINSLLPFTEFVDVMPNYNT